MTENVKEDDVLDCPNYGDKICILSLLKKMKNSSKFFRPLKSKTDDGLSSCSKFPEHLEAIMDVLDRNQDVFSRHKADIGCCNFVEHEIELEELAVPHREGRGA